MGGVWELFSTDCGDHFADGLGGEIGDAVGIDVGLEGGVEGGIEVGMLKLEGGGDDEISAGVGAVIEDAAAVAEVHFGGGDGSGGFGFGVVGFDAY